MEELLTGLTTGITSIVSDSMGAIGTIVPVVLPIVGAGIVVGLAFKYLKKAGK